MRYWLLGLSMLSLPVMADSLSTERIDEKGERLSLNTLASGEVWGSFFLSDQSLNQFDLHEMVIMQIDDHKPIKFERGLRSCGTPASKVQQTNYVFSQSDEQNGVWAYEKSQPVKPVLKLLGWDDEQFDKLEADWRDTVIDFPIREEWLVQQIMHAEKVSFRYTTTDGELKTSEFELSEQ